MALSARGEYTLHFPNPVDEYWSKFTGNSYDETTNPEGVINMNIAENTLCTDLITERMNRPDMQTFEPWMQRYNEHRGTPRFRASVAAFLTRFFKAATPLDPDNIILTTGGDAAMDFLLHAVTDPGDCILVPAPYYYSIRQTAGMRNRVTCVDVPMQAKSNDADAEELSISVDLLETHLNQATEQGKRVSAVMVLNPNNPTGTISDLSTLQSVLEFANRHDLHVIVDEIYGLSVFGDGADFHSVLELPTVPNPDRTHFLWGFSKDFSLPGMHVGVIHSANKNLAPSLNHMSGTASVPTIVQDKLRKLIEDEEWISQVYLPANRDRLRTSSQYAATRLTKLGIKCSPCKAAFYIWADFTKYAKTREEERSLCYKFLDAGVFLNPGTPMASLEPGWFRITISHTVPYLKTALDRIEMCLSKST